MKTYNPKFRLPLRAALCCALGLGSSAFGQQVSLKPVDPKDASASQQQQADKADEGPTFSRKIWTGSFDRAADASGAAARQLGSQEYGCEDYNDPSKQNMLDRGDRSYNPNLYQICLQRQAAAQQAAQQAHSIQKQQNMMSIVSKASDVAAVGAVGGVIYAEMGVKQNNQAGTYASAANIEQTAGQVSYVTGAADLTMGAYAYVAQKNKLEQIKASITGSKDGAVANNDAAVTRTLTNAVEAAKKAAYAHMLWGAGKLAAGYGMMYVAKQSQNQAQKMQSIQDLQEQNQAMQLAAAAQGTPLAPPPGAVPVGIGTVPYYQNANPQFALPNSGTAASALAAHTGPVTYTLPGGGTGSSAAPTAAQTRGLASAAAAAKSGIGGGGGGGGASSGGGDAAASADDPAKEKTEKSAKEAMGSSFELQLTGGPKPYGGGPGAAGGGKDEIPNLASLMGNGAADAAGATAATGISPAQLFQAAREGNDGAEQGSLAGVSGKSEISLFDITKAKLTKMFQIGNVGIPKNVEVKN